MDKYEGVYVFRYVHEDGWGAGENAEIELIHYVDTKYERAGRVFKYKTYIKYVDWERSTFHNARTAEEALIKKMVKWTDEEWEAFAMTEVIDGD